MVKLQLKGMLAPVFTPLSSDKNRIEIDVIEKYGQMLKQKGIQGVLVNGTVGEGTTLRIDERKRLAEEWMKVSRKLGMTMLLEIGGIGIADVEDLVEHAEKIGVDAIVLMPDLFYKPLIEEDLVDYIKEVTKRAPTRPVLLHHSPKQTNVMLNMLRLNELIQRALNNWSGILFRDTNIELAQDLLREGVNIILATDTILPGVLALGIESISSVVLNLMPEAVLEINDLIMNGKLREAREVNEKLIRRIKEIIHSPTADWIEAMKIEVSKKLDLKLGGVRKPRQTINRLM